MFALSTLIFFVAWWYFSPQQPIPDVEQFRAQLRAAHRNALITAVTIFASGFTLWVGVGYAMLRSRYEASP
jgi:hypothetical protein